MTPPKHTTTTTTVLLTTAVVLGALLPAPSTTAAPPPPTAQAHPHAPDGVVTDGETRARARRCAPVEQAFRPVTATVPDVVGRTRVLALGRDRNGVPRTPPLTDRGKWQFAWDRASRIRPGGRYGVVRLNAHTYPRSGAYGSALGNRLLNRLHIGDGLTLAGPDHQRLCYRVTRRYQVRLGASLRGYYSSTGPSRLAILVCSGRRRGPGDWSHRTIWFAKPVGV